MVLFKRKPVQYVPRPVIGDDNTEVWVIPTTEEVFVEYEKYLTRIDFYKQRKFSCEITGHSQLNFFEAQKSEVRATSDLDPALTSDIRITDAMDKSYGSKEVDSAFPDALKEPVLRKVQFSVVSRIDHLVDQVFEDFKRDFYPGERVTVLLTDGARIDGLVREKAKFPEIMGPNGVERKAFSRYFVRLINRPHEEALVDDEHIVRDRKAFTKQMLRSFLKHCLTREAWTGAPWLVKDEYAREYRIDTDVPPHLRQGHKLAEKKASIAAARKGEQEGMLSFWAGSPMQRLPELKPALKGQKVKFSAQEQEVYRQENMQEYHRAMNGNPTFVVSNGTKPPKGGHFVQETNFPGLQSIAARSPPPKVVPPPPVKYPIDDLDVAPIRDGTHRPALNFMSEDTPVDLEDNASGTGSGIKMESVQSLMETWLMLNVFCDGFVLDSFTFDDYIEAIRFTSDDVECELFNEVHCAVLKLFVNSENNQNGKINISLPEIEEEESETSHHTSAVPTPSPEPQVKPKGMRTRSSLIHSESVDDIPEKSPSDTAEAKIHRAAELFDDYGWVERLRKRDFSDGGWQMIMVGLLHQLSIEARQKQKIEEILAHLVPLDAAPTQFTVQTQYRSLDFNLRVRALEIICMLTMETEPIRVYLLDAQTTMTDLRKAKIEHQRNRKAILEELRLLQEEQRRLQPNDPTPTPPPELAEGDGEGEGDGDGDGEGDGEDSKMTGVAGTSDEEEMADSEDEEPIQSRSLRRGADRAAERKRREAEERERKEKAEALAKQSKGDKQYQRVLKKIDDAKARIKAEEKAISGFDDDLREADSGRLKVLGFDRFWNRYYWLERNAMPYGGLPSSSTAHAAYACARLFVQGPDESERLGFIDVGDEINGPYYKSFQMTIAERKKMEEGPTSVFTATQFGYYDDPDSIEMLIGWLDTRGKRELKLRKELQARRETMTKYMGNRKTYLSSEKPAPPDEPTTRMSTRTKTYVADTTSHRCLKWTNDTAKSQLGHLHSEPAPTRNKKAKKSKADDGSRRVTNRQGRPLTRQGTRYNFG